MNTEAFFSDTSENYCFPAEPDPGETVRVRFRVSREDHVNVEFVAADSGESIPMFTVGADRYFRYFEIQFEVGDEPVLWYFRISDRVSECFYDASGVMTTHSSEYPFRLYPGFHTPDWAKGAVMYQIFVDRFCRGRRDNDVLDDEYIYIGLPVRHIEDWNENPSTFDVGYFYGGDLSGVQKKLDYLRDLGVEVIYFNPIFVSPSNHKYDTQDYEHIDPHLTIIVNDEGEVLPRGAVNNEMATKYICRTTDRENLEASDRFFANFIREAHEKGMKVILDGVFNHCGSFNKWMDREKIYSRSGKYAPGAFESADSPYRSYFEFSRNDYSDWPDNKSYDGWWDNDTLPKLNYEASERLVNTILGIGRKWLMPPYRVDGWRLDVAADLGHSSHFNHSFWARFRQMVKSVNPDALILAEHYGNPAPWLNGKEWDSIMNYDAFMEPVSWFLTGMEKHSDRSDPSLRGDGKRFWEMMRFNMAKLPMPSLLVAMNELSNHDHSRFLTRTNHVTGRLQTMGSFAAEEGVNYAVMRQAVVMQMTWPGAPTIYYGDESGVCGWTDPDSRRTYPWGRENHELQDFHRYMCRIHQAFDACRRGSLVPLLMQEDLVSYGRVLYEEKIIVFVYTGEEEKILDLPVWRLGIREYDNVRRLILTTDSNYNVGVAEYAVQNGILSLRIKKNSAGVFAAQE
ncbi:MAG: glycoside hydrolase family 13 protein [Stomatobaculum sp.]|nr:glycoside hydrolase family 13 protein [Stomatobaculum sp.]